MNSAIAHTPLSLTLQSFAPFFRFLSAICALGAASAVRRSEEETGFAIRDLRLAEQQPLGKNNKTPQKSSFELTPTALPGL